MFNRTIEERVKATFHHLHNHAEISWEETKTTAYLAKLLKEAGCKVATFDDCTGVIGDYGSFDAVYLSSDCAQTSMPYGKKEVAHSR